MTATAYDLLIAAAEELYARADEGSLLALEDAVRALGDAVRTFDAQRHSMSTETALCVLKRTDFGKNAQKPQ